MTDKEEFKKIAMTYIKRNGIVKLLNALEDTDFYTAPASTKYHDSCEGGLLTHSLLVFHNLYDNAYANYDSETIAICGLFHDICKVGFYKTEKRNTKDEHGKWIQVPYYTVDDKFPYGHGEKSVYMINDCMKLTDEEAMAINAHMGGFDERKYIIGNTFDKCKLAVLLHIADLKATYL